MKRQRNLKMWLTSGKCFRCFGKPKPAQEVKTDQRLKWQCSQDKAGCLYHFPEHFQQLLSHPWPQGNEDLPIKLASDDNMDICIQPVIEAEVAAALKYIKNGCSSDICSITTELLKVAGVRLTHWIINIINKVWIREELPDYWRCSVILPFWKQKEDKLICSNQWGITLLSVPGKLFTYILLTWALPAICCKCIPQQASFMPTTQQSIIHWQFDS